MCGIAGFFGPWPRTLLEDMADVLHHRGPDGQGVHHEPEAGLGLTQTRLAIIDLSSAAAQPMADPSGRYWLSYNGEIYNYRDLRRELQSAGVAFRSQSDTEVLLHALIRWGEDALDRLNGIFAFAFWDSADRQLLLARDHLGVKPLYVAELDKGLLFASEIKALTLCPDLPRAIHAPALLSHVGLMWSADRHTALAGVDKLRPGEVMRVGPAGTSRRIYYRTPLPQDGAPAAPGDLAQLLDRIVADQMVADVPVGALLSGGLDSSAIVASMCQATDPRQVTAFCASTEKDHSAGDNFGDDLTHAQAVARHVGINLVEVPIAADLLEHLPEMIWSLDEPTGDFSAWQSYLLAREAKSQGVTVLLSGAGGDDLFTGYGRHRAALLYHRLRGLGPLRPALGAVLARLPGPPMARRRFRRVADLLTMDEETMQVQAQSYAALHPQDWRSLFTAGVRAGLPSDGVPVAVRQRLAESAGAHPVSRMLDLDMWGFLPDLNLNYTDKMAMKASVEVRVPLLDRRLVDFAAALPLTQKIDSRQTKRLFRESQRGRLPDEVLTRPKQGFGVPLRAWLAGSARGLMEDLTSRPALEAHGLFDPDAVAALRRDFLSGKTDAAIVLFGIMVAEIYQQRLAAAPVSQPRAA